MRGSGFEQLKEVADVVYDPSTVPVPFRYYGDEQVAARVEEAGATILVVEADQVGPKTLDQPLRVVGCTRGDPNNVDVAAATARGIPVLRAPGRNADGVAELTVGLLFAATRGIVEGDRQVRAGETYKDGSIPYQRFRAWELAGRTVGIVGYGAIGRALAWRLTGLGMKVLAYDPYAPDATSTLDELLAEADVISMHAPVTPETRAMIGAEQFARMREGAVYLNAARAALHDTDALVRALESGHLAAAGLDHFEGERLPVDHPLVSMPQVVLTPHIGGATFDTETNHARMIGEGITAVLRGERPANLVNPEVMG